MIVELIKKLDYDGTWYIVKIGEHKSYFTEENRDRAEALYDRTKKEPIPVEHIIKTKEV